MATPAANAVAEGADATYTAITPTTRLANQTQISRKTFSISDTQEKVKKAGRASDIRYNTVKQGKELRRDMELACIENPVFVTGATRQTRGLRGWITTNQSTNGGTPPNGTNNSIVDGTLRNFDETILRAIVLGAFTNGGNPKMLMVAPTIKQRMSLSFVGNGTRYVKSEAKKLVHAYDVYESDFGDFDIVPNRTMVRTREAYLLDPDYLAVAMLRDMETEELARIGSARNYMIESEYALEVREQRAQAVARDIQ